MQLSLKLPPAALALGLLFLGGMFGILTLLGPARGDEAWETF